MARVVFIALAQLCFVLTSQARTFDRCQLAHELNRQGFPRHQLANWVCLVEKESSRQTHAVGGPNVDGSYDHGLFQINDRYWCNNGPTPGKECNVKCSDITTDDISKASACAKKIYSQRGFNAWVAWVNSCSGKPLPDLRPCGL